MTAGSGGIPTRQQEQVPDWSAIDRLMTHVRFAVDGYVLGKWSLYQAGAQICEELAAYYAANPDGRKR